MYQFYPTPYSVISDLIDLGFIQDGNDILEPCAGKGDIIQRIKECHNVNITAVEIAKQFALDIAKSGSDRTIIGNFFDLIWDQKFDKIVCNPPFSLAEEFIEKCHSLLKPDGKMAFLLRLSMLCGLKRYSFYQKYKPSYINVLSRRMPFNGNAVDSCGYAWVIWDNPITDYDTTLRWINPNPI